MFFVVCLLPLLNIVAISFSSSAAVEGNMVGLIPVGFSTAATVADIDPATIRMIGWPGASYDRYDDDGVTIPAE